ncbi:nucleotidyltransferase domain-containing protein [Candidatus Woesearchaeota archaeon]|nr:nucleotidyltransferase domain-containing protein [Candidatus Woesearchaeota archaeon]
MDMYKLKFTRLQNQIVRLLCIKHGKALNQREIAQSLDVSPTAVAKAVKGIGLIKRTKTKVMTTIELDMEKASMIKRTENLRLIYESGLADQLEGHFPGCAIILFGSYSFGEDTVKSDIDIAIIGKKKDIRLERFEKLLERTINLQFYHDIKSVHANLRQNIINGIVIKGLL